MVDVGTLTDEVLGWRVVVSCADSGELCVLRLQARDGQWTLIQRLPLCGQLMPMALRPDGRHLWVARRSEPLALVHVGRTPQGGLGFVDETPLPASMACLSTDASGRWLFAASYGADLLSIHPIDAVGSVGAAHLVLSTGRHAHMAALRPGASELWASALGADVLHRWHFHDTYGDVDPMPSLAAPAGSGPRHFRFSTDGRHVYVLGELDACIHHWTLSAGGPQGEEWMYRGASALLTFEDVRLGVTPWAADLQMTPDGRFLYACDRNSHRVSGFAIDPVHGGLMLVGRWEAPRQPRTLAVTPDGRWLLAAGQLSHDVWSWRIDAVEGQLSLAGQQDVGQNPNWLLVLPPGAWPL
jgi:6-phosphogluconolactonase